MKKIYALVLAAALLLLGTQAKAQFHIGVGYLNSTEITHYNNGDKPFSEMMHGFYLGGTFNIKVAGDFGMSRFGGFNFESGIYRELALNIPVNLTYDFEINDNVRIFVYGGVNLQFTPLARTTYREGTAAPGGVVITPRGPRTIFVVNGNTYKYDHLWGEEPDMRPFNVYAGGGVGVMLGDIRIMAGYDHSLLNISRIDGERTGRSQFKIGVNFVFGND